MSLLIGAYGIELALGVAFGVQLLVEGTTLILGRASRAWFPLTPRRRVSHLLCDSDASLRNKWFNLLFFAVLFAYGTWQSWTKVLSESTPRFVKIGLVLFGTVVVVITIRYAIRNVLRIAIAQQLRDEQSRWDPDLTNPKVFVIKRDIVPDTIELYNRITLACYERGITLMQYIDFEWPRYKYAQTPLNKHSQYFKESNPEAAAKADAVLWIDIGEQSQAMKMELDEAKKLGRMIVRLASHHGSRTEFIVEADSGVLQRIDKDDLPERVRDIFHRYFMSNKCGTAAAMNRMRR